ncbi:hypothetical protein, partial [Candidatus Protofrankia datiscae]
MRNDVEAVCPNLAQARVTAVGRVVNRADGPKRPSGVRNIYDHSSFVPGSGIAEALSGYGSPDSGVPAAGFLVDSG